MLAEYNYRTSQQQNGFGNAASPVEAKWAYPVQTTVQIQRHKGQKQISLTLFPSRVEKNEPKQEKAAEGKRR